MDGGHLADPHEVDGDFRSLFDQVAVPMAVVSTRGERHFVAASRGFLTALELRRPSVVGHSLDTVLAPQGSAALAAAIDRCHATSETVRVDVELRASPRRRFVTLAVHSVRARGFSGQVVLELVGGGHSLHPTGQRFASLYSQVGDDRESATFIHDLKSRRARFVDGGLATRLGLHGGALHIREFFALMHPDDLAEQPAAQARRGALGDGELLTQTLRLRDRDGAWRLISFRTRVLRRDSQGAPRLMLGSAVDITNYAAAAVEAAGISVTRAEGNERARLGRELHDSTSQHLVAADLGLALALRNERLTPDDRARLVDVQASVITAQKEIRAFAYFLHPPELREFGLSRTVEKFCAGFARRTCLQITFTDRGPAVELPFDVELALFRVCQEALMNVYRHAFARRVAVSLDLKGEQLVLEVRDDGIGVDAGDRFEHGGVGLAGMKARMLSIRGDLTLDHRGPGLAVIARAPVA